MLVSIFQDDGNKFKIIASDGIRSREVVCKSNRIIANLFLLKFRFWAKLIG